MATLKIPGNCVRCEKTLIEGEKVVYINEATVTRTPARRTEFNDTSQARVMFKNKSKLTGGMCMSCTYDE
jgi:hypothetical protein